jgi:uncharacterized protein (DUF1330 family)
MGVSFERKLRTQDRTTPIMKTKHTLALGMLAGLGLGMVSISIVHAVQQTAPPAYLVAEVDVQDPTTFQKYAAQVPGTIAPFGGHYLIRGGKSEALEGEPPKRFVVLAFDSLEKAKAWYSSPAYQAIVPIRHSSAKTRGFLIEGVLAASPPAH